MATQWLLHARNGQMLEPKRPRYSNQQRILTVGDGDFSFTLWLATEVGVAFNIVATSLDTRGELWQKYGMDAELNLWNLAQRRVRLVFHGFDACKMATEVTEQTELLCAFQMSYFDCIIFNFPHAGFWGREDDPHMIEKHKELVRSFFANARKMLLPGGQVHVSHKLGHPYDDWELEVQANMSGLRLVRQPVPFHREHYPGYQNRRGHGFGAGESFKLGPAATYIFAARIEEPPARTWNVGEPLGMSITMLAHPNSLKEKAVCKARASHVTSLQQVVADEATGLEKLQLGKKKMKMKTLATLKPTLQQMNLENSPTSLSCTTDEPSASTLNVGEPLGMSSTMLAHLKSLKEKAVCKAGASEETSLQQVLADEVTRLEKLPLGKKKMKTLETLKSALQQMNLANCQGSLATLAENLGGSPEEEHSKIIEMDVASLSNSTDHVKWSLQNIGCTESTLPLFSPETNEEDMDRVSQVNPNEVLVPEREDITKFHSTFDTSLWLSEKSAGVTIFTVDKIEEEIKEDCPSSKQKSPLREIQLVAPLQRNDSCAAEDQHVNSALNVGDPVAVRSTILAHLKSLKQAIRKARASQVNPLQQVVADEVARLDKLKEEEKLGKKKMKTLETLKSALQQTNFKENFQLVEASVEALAQDLGIFLEEENEEIAEMDRAVSASLSSAADIEWGSQSSGCTKSLSLETVDLSFQVNSGNGIFEKGEDPTKFHDILEPSPQFSRVPAETISTVDKAEEINVDCLSSKQESQLVGIQLVDDVAPLQRKMKESFSLKESFGLNEESVGGSSTDSAPQYVEGRFHLEALARFLQAERIEMVKNSDIDIEWGSQSNCCSTKSSIRPFSPETAYDLDLSFQLNPGKEVLVTEKEDITESHFALEILEPSPQTKESETIFTAENLLEEEIKEDSKQKAGSKYKLEQNSGSKHILKQKSELKQKLGLEQKLKKPGTIFTVDNVDVEEKEEDSKQKPKKKLKKKRDLNLGRSRKAYFSNVLWR